LLCKSQPWDLTVLHILARFTIRTKVVAAFGFVLCCAIGLGVFAASRVALLTHTAALIGTDVVASNAVSDAQAAGERLLSLGFALHAAQTGAERDSLTPEIERTARSVVEKWTKYAADGIDPGEDQRFADAVLPAWKRYEGTMRKVIELDKAGSHQEAGSLLIGDGQKTAGEFRQAISASLGFQTRQGTNAVDEAANIGISARNMIIAVLLYHGDRLHRDRLADGPEHLTADQHDDERDAMPGAEGSFDRYSRGRARR
jgi:methyl-accepting chemotaxis protein